MRRSFSTVFFILMVCVVRPAHAVLEVDLTSHLVAIESDFFGENISLFGAISGGGDVIAVVRGPRTNFKVHHKENISGLWINTRSAVFDSVPSFYAVASSAPLDQIIDDDLLAQRKIGVGYLGLDLPGNRAHAQWRQGLLDNLFAHKIYQKEPGEIRFLGDRLFRTKFSLPPNVPVGRYDVMIYHIRNGAVVGLRSEPLYVAKAGLEAGIYRFAQNQPLYYGIFAVVVALIAGWLGHIVFRR